MSDILLRGHLIFPLSLAVSLNNSWLTATEGFWFSGLPDAQCAPSCSDKGVGTASVKVICLSY